MAVAGSAAEAGHSAVVGFAVAGEQYLENSVEQENETPREVLELDVREFPTCHKWRNTSWCSHFL